MKLLKILVLVVFTSLSACTSVNDEYSNRLTQKIREDNERKRESLSYTYLKIDQAHAMNVVTGWAANWNPVAVKARSLKSYCNNLNEKLDQVTYESFNVDTFQLQVSNFKEHTFSLISPDYDDHRELVNSIFDPKSVSELEFLSENEFKIEFELFKGRFIETEYMTAEIILHEIDYWERDSTFIK